MRSSPRTALDLDAPRTAPSGSRDDREPRGMAASGATLLALAHVSDVAHAQNAIPNGRFDDDIMPYVPGNAATISHDPTLDLGGPAGSGSLEVVNN